MLWLDANHEQRHLPPLLSLRLGPRSSGAFFVLPPDVTALNLAYSFSGDCAAAGRGLRPHRQRTNRSERPAWGARQVGVWRQPGAADRRSPWRVQMCADHVIEPVRQP
jgi:hypothetical protein